MDTVQKFASMGRGVGRGKRGMALGLALLCTLMLFMMGATYLSVVHSDLRFQAIQHRTTQAQYLVWSGLEFYVSSKADTSTPALVYNGTEGLTFDFGPGQRVWIKEIDSDGTVQAAGILVDEQNHELLRRVLYLQRETSGTGWIVPVNWRGATIAPQI